MDVIVPNRGYRAPAPRVGAPRVPQRPDGTIGSPSDPTYTKPERAVPERAVDRSFARTAQKAIALSDAVEKTRQPEKPSRQHHFKRLFNRRLLVDGLVVAILVVTGIVFYNTWQTNHQAQQILSQKPATVVASAAKTASDSTSVSTDPLPKNTLADYRVAADLPRAIYITKLNIAARLLPMSVNTDDSMQAPGNVNDAGWYTGSAKPGQNGAVVVDGHASETGTHYGLFGNLLSLKVGDEITIERGDGQRFTYSVVHTEVDPLAGLDMSKLMIPYGGASQGLNLITCTGKWTKDGSTLDHRLLVFAVPTK